MPAGSRPDLTLEGVITSHPDVMGGRRVFRGTRVPVEVLFENLADGMSVDDILSEYEALEPRRRRPSARTDLIELSAPESRLRVVVDEEVPRQLVSALRERGIDADRFKREWSRRATGG